MENISVGSYFQFCNFTKYRAPMQMFSCKFYKEYLSVLQSFAKFIRKYPFGSLFLINKNVGNMCLPVNFAKFIETPVLQSTNRRLLLLIQLSKFKLDISLGKSSKHHAIKRHQFFEVTDLSYDIAFFGEKFFIAETKYGNISKCQ